MTLESAFPVPSVQNSSGFPGALGKKQEWTSRAKWGSGPDYTEGWDRVRSAGTRGCHPKQDVTFPMWHLSFQPPPIERNSGQAAGPAGGAESSGADNPCGRRKPSLWDV